MIYTNRLNYRQTNERPKAFWGAFIPAAINFVGGLISSSSQARAQKRAMEEQQRLAKQQLEVSNQNNLAATLNNYTAAQDTYDTNDYNLKYRNGGTRRLGSNGIVITDGGNARKIGNNTYLLRGGSHEDINETGQTGIGINIDGNEIEAEGGEVAQKKNGSLRIFSAQPMLNGGLSPAQAILRGYNKDKVFTAQQRFKRNNHLKDDGTKARKGGLFQKLYTAATGKQLGQSNYYKGSDGKYHPKRTEIKINPDGSYRSGDFINQSNGKRIVNQLPLQQVSPEFDIIAGLRGLNITTPQKPAMNLGLRNKAISNSAKYRRFVANRYSKGKNYSNEILDKTYETALNKGQKDVVKDLRKTHFVKQANNAYVDNNGNLIQLYHTTNAENPDFHIFDTNIEGRPTGIYTTDNLNMSKSYNRKSRNNSKLIKRLYSGSNSINNGNLVIDGNGNYWNNLQIAFTNKTLYPKLYHNGLGGELTTRDIERAMFNTKDVDRVIINNVKDYGGGFINDFKPSTVLINQNPSNLKYSNPITYDDKGNFIPLSQRDNFRNPDMRYKIGGRCKLRNGGKVRKDNYYDWISAISSNLGISPIDGTYDYRTYYNSVTPYERSLMRYAPQGTHFTDVGKRPSHPTFSNESKYSNSKTPGGNWDDNVFIPSMWQFGNDGNKKRNNYMNNTGEGYFDGRRNVFPRSKKIYGGKDDNGRNSKKTVHFYKSKSGRVFKTIKEVAQDNYNYNNNVGYRITTKENNYNKSLTKKDINIPFIKSKAITLSNAGRATGAKLSTNQLDSIAKYANRAGLSIPKAFGLVMKESTFNNPTVGHVQFIQNENTQNNESNRWINNNNWTYKRNPYTEAIDAANKNEKNKTIKDWDNQVINGEKYADKLAKKLKAQPFTVGIEDGFRKYKTNPYKYNPGQKNYVQLVNQNARNIMNSPQIRQWYKTSPYAKGRRYKCGGITTPRRRYADGGITDLTGTTVYGRNRFNTSAWDNYMKNKALGFMNNMSIPNTPYQQSSYTPQVQSYLNLMSTPFTGRQSSFKPATQDYIGLGIDTLAALGSGFFTRNAYNKLNFNYNLPSYVDETPVAFDTTYHNEAQRANVERNRINGRNLIQGNTASAQTALSRMQQGDTNAMMELNKLADEKANKEVELRNQNAANEQQVRARNAAARNQYYQNIAQIQNAALEAKNNAALAKAQSIGTDLSGLAQAWSNFATSVENRYDSRQNQIAMVASANNPAVTQTALRMGYDFSPETLAGLYNTTNDENMKRLILSKMSTRDRIKYGIK